jgi:hypothetical protein
MAALSRALATHTLGLRTLLLAQNRIKPEQAVILAEGLEKNASLQHITLDGNPLGSMGRCVLSFAEGCAELMRARAVALFSALWLSLSSKMLKRMRSITRSKSALTTATLVRSQPHPPQLLHRNCYH